MNTFIRAFAFMLPTLMLCACATSNTGPSPDAPLPQVSAGSIERIANVASKYVPPRHVEVWLPDGYPAAGRYAVLYMHDGQMLFDGKTTWNGQEWRVDEVASALQAAGRVRPFIVVGVWNAGAARYAEYFPQQAFNQLDQAYQNKLRQQVLAGRAGDSSEVIYSDRYLRFLVEELKPLIDARYATERDRQSTFIAGSSMGGLISLYALAQYPAVFGGAACLSTHWPGGGDFNDPTLSNALLGYMRASFPSAGQHRVYFDYGTATLDQHYPPLQAKADAILRKKGYTAADWLTREFPGDEHAERAWATRLHIPLTFLLGKPL